jgi:hypothetical protein
MAKNCKHDHECESCVREEIKAVEAKLRALKAKLPSQTITICNHGCHGLCNHNLFYHNTPQQFYSSTGLAGQTNLATAGIASTTQTTGYLGSATSSSNSAYA